MALSRFQKGSHEKLSEYFKAYEFDCPCLACKETLVEMELVLRLSKLREKIGPITITSGYRCVSHQRELEKRGYETARGISQHSLGRAADLKAGSLSGAQLEAQAREAGFQAVGVARTWIHADLREQFARWFYIRDGRPNLT